MPKKRHSAEQIIHNLSHLNGLRVIAAASSFYFKDRTLGVREMGRLLGITQALEMPVVALVATEGGAATAGFAGERLLLVDLHLHRASVTELRQGEEIVRELARRLADTIGDAERVARLRGDEFGVLLPDASAEIGRAACRERV